MILRTICVGMMGVNCYILASSRNKRAMIIDPGDDVLEIKKALKEHNLKPALIVNTHGHIDHIGGDNDFGVPVYIHTQDKCMLTDAGLNLSSLFGPPFMVNALIKTVEEGSTIDLDDIVLKVIHTPGHTPGGICLLMLSPDEGKTLFTGDSLFRQSIGRTDFKGGSERLLIDSIKQKILILGNGISVYPGHGPASSIAEEKNNNPFLS